MKQLRENFTPIRNGLRKGQTFLLMYRSKPLAKLVPQNENVETINNSKNKTSKNENKANTSNKINKSKPTLSLDKVKPKRSHLNKYQIKRYLKAN